MHVYLSKPCNDCEPKKYRGPTQQKHYQSKCDFDKIRFYPKMKKINPLVSRGVGTNVQYPKYECTHTAAKE